MCLYYNSDKKEDKTFLCDLLITVLEFFLLIHVHRDGDQRNKLSGRQRPLLDIQ